MSHIEELRYRYIQTSDFDPRKLSLLHKVESAIQQEVDLSILPYIVVLGASMDKRKRGWVLPSIVESDREFIVGGKTRAMAAKQLVEEGFQGKFLVTGGTQYQGEEAVSRAQILAGLMMNRYAIDQSQVEVIGTNGNGNTLGNVANTTTYFEKNGTPNGLPIGLLTNTWHIERSLLMFLHDRFFEDNAVSIYPLSADDILHRVGNPHLDRWMESFQNHPKMEERIYMEQQGMLDLLQGRYEPLSR